MGGIEIAHASVKGNGKVQQDAETPIKQDEEAFPQDMVNLVRDMGEPNDESTVITHHPRTIPPTQSFTFSYCLPER